MCRGRDNENEKTKKTRTKAQESRADDDEAFQSSKRREGLKDERQIHTHGQRLNKERKESNVQQQHM